MSVTDSKLMPRILYIDEFDEICRPLTGRDLAEYGLEDNGPHGAFDRNDLFRLLSAWRKHPYLHVMTFYEDYAVNHFDPEGASFNLACGDPDPEIRIEYYMSPADEETQAARGRAWAELLGILQRAIRNS